MKLRRKFARVCCRLALTLLAMIVFLLTETWAQPYTITAWDEARDPTGAIVRLPFPTSGRGAVAFGRNIIILTASNPSRTLILELDQNGRILPASGPVSPARESMGIPSTNTRPIPVLVGNYLVVPLAGESYIGQVQSDGSISSWSTGPGTANTAINGRALAVDGERIYSIAGGIPFASGTIVEVATLSSGGSLSPWSVLRSLSAPVHDPMAAVINGFLYIFGGESFGGALSNSREVWRAGIRSDGTIDPWSFVGNLRDQRPHSTFLRHNGTIHIVAGGVHSFYLNSVESVGETLLGLASPVSSASLPTILNEAAAVVVGNKGYVLGGTDAFFGTHVSDRIFVAELGPQDTNPPVVTATRTPQANPAGWNNTDVKVDFTCTDDTGVGTPPVTPVTLVHEGAGLSASASCTDLAGNSATASVNDINIDKTLPSTNLLAPIDGAIFLLNQKVAASFDCSDALSGVNICAGNVPNGADIDTVSVGAKQFTVNAQDEAGNTSQVSATYHVRYAFGGFLQPVDNLPATNVARAGRTIPIKWQLRNASGSLISDVSSFASFASAPIACDASPTAILEEEAAESAGSTWVRWDANAQQFIFNWQTSSAWRGCRVLQLTLKDGTQHWAKFEFR